MLSSKLCVLFLFAAVFFVFSDQGQGDNNRNNNPPRLSMNPLKNEIRDLCKNKTEKVRNRFCKSTGWLNEKSNRPKSGSVASGNGRQPNTPSSDPNGSPQYQKYMEQYGTAGEKLGTACEQLDKFKKLSAAGSTALGKVADAAGKAAAAARTVSRVLGTMSTVFGALGKLANVLGPIGAAVGAIFSIVAAFLPKEDEMEKLQKFMQVQFDKVHERFDKLEMKLDKLELIIEKTIVYAGYIENQDRIHKAMFAHRMMLARFTNKTIQEFQETCRLENPLFALDWIYRHVMVDEDAEFGPHLLPTVFKDVEYNRTRLLQFFSVVLSDMMTAAYLREACIGAEFGPTNDNDTMLMLDEELEANRETMSEMISAVSRKMKVYEEKLMTNPGPQLAKDLAYLVNETEQHDERQQLEVIELIKAQLNETYYWLSWSVYMINKEKAYNISGDPTRYAVVRGKTYPSNGNVHTFFFFWAELEKIPLLKQSVGAIEITGSVGFENRINLKFTGYYKGRHAENVLERNSYVVSYYYSKTMSDTGGCSEPQIMPDQSSVYFKPIYMTRDEACPTIAFAARVKKILRKVGVSKDSEADGCVAAKKQLDAFDQSKMWLVGCAKNHNGEYSITVDNQAEKFEFESRSKKLFAMWSRTGDPLLEFEAGLANETLASTVQEIVEAQVNLSAQRRIQDDVHADSIVNNITQYIADPTLYCQDNVKKAWYPVELCSNPPNYFENKAVVAIWTGQNGKDMLVTTSNGAKNYAAYHTGGNIEIVKGNLGVHIQVYVHYFSPSGLGNTPHCTMSDEQLKKYGIKNPTKFHKRHNC